MPKIFEYFGFIFYFFSNEHEPIHVHVQKGDKESIFELIMMDGKLCTVTSLDYLCGLGKGIRNSKWEWTKKRLY